MHADKIYVLERGQIIETGTHQQLLNEKGLYYAMWRQQIGGKKICDSNGVVYFWCPATEYFQASLRRTLCTAIRNAAKRTAIPAVLLVLLFLQYYLALTLIDILLSFAFRHQGIHSRLGKGRAITFRTNQLGRVCTGKS